jgi:endonuclease YncB( thermonuclease family)
MRRSLYLGRNSCAPRVALAAGFAVFLSFATIAESGAQDSKQRTIRNVTPDGIPIIVLPPREDDRNTRNVKIAPDIRGEAVVATLSDDGTIEVNGRTIIPVGTRRLPGDALCERPPGGRWACGLRAHVALRNFVHGRTLNCEIVAERADGAVARCYRDKTDLSEWILAEGWGLYDASSSEPALSKTAEDAKQKSRGIWENGSQPAAGQP